MGSVVLLASLMIQVSLGGVYAWSAFWPSLQAEYGLSAVQTQVIFGASVTSFTLNMVLAGRLFRRLGPRLASLLGGLLFAAGYLLASASGGSFLGLFAGLALLTGAGVGFAYVCPIATCIQWYPSRKGLVTGLIVGGFGAGGVVLAHVAEAVLERGVAILDLFRWVGLLFGGTVVLSSLFLSLPPGAEAANAARERFVVRDLLVRRDYWVLTIGVFCGTFAGLLVIGNLKPIGLAAGSTALAATWAISTLSIGNACGRFAWGAIVDRFGRIIIPISLCVLSLGVALTALAGRVSWAFVVVAAAVGFGYGSCFVVYAAQVAVRFGPGCVASHYPVVFLSYGVSGSLGPIVGGWLFDRTGSHLPGILTAASIAALGAILCGLLDAVSRRRPGISLANGIDTG